MLSKAARRIRKPTERQAAAGNYRKGHVRWQGLDITIETRRGDRRWSAWPPLAAHYGYVKRTEGADGDHVDVYLGPSARSELVVVVDQVDLSGRFDEHKVMLGFRSTPEAVDAYRRSYTPGWRVGPVTTLTIDQFKAWLQSGNQSKPIAKQVSRYSTAEETAMPTFAQSFIERYRVTSAAVAAGESTLAGQMAAAFSEHYAARGPKNSPGQMGFFNQQPLRSNKTQQRMPWDEAKHPRDAKGQFSEKPEARAPKGAGGKAKQPGTPAGISQPGFSNQEAKPGDQPGLLEGEGKRAERKKPDFDSKKGKTSTMFGGMDAEPGQMDFFGGDGTPDDLVMGGGESEDAKTPREEAAEATEEQQDDYAFARKSAVPNAGEDLAGSARHKRNEWRSLEEAESEGTAEKLVTRDKLLKNEPHELAAYVEKEPFTALVMHQALKAFPAKPGYGSRPRDEERQKKDRKDYLEAYRSIKTAAEQIAASGEDDPVKASRALAKEVRDKISELRKGDSYNNTANALITLHNRLATPSRKNAIARKVAEFGQHFKQQHPDDSQALRRAMIDGALSVMEGKTMNAVMGAKKGGPKRFNPADAYVAHAEREGGPKVPAKSATEATKYMVDELGLRGVQFGNSVSDKERQHHATKAAEALVDLADVTGLPLESISIGGKLGLAMGARGKGRAVAHYEPDSKVINLTRKGGVGSLAHEWGHALDHELGGGDLMRSGRSHKLEASYFSEAGPITYFSQRDASGKMISKKEDRTTDPLYQAMDGVREAWQSSGFRSRLTAELTQMERNGQLGKRGVGSKDYYASRREMLARTFERYVQRKLENNGRKNTYLAGIKEKGGVWPTDEEVDHMAPAFDKLMDTYRTDRLGVPERAQYSPAERQAFIERFVAEAERWESEAEQYAAKKPKDSPGQMGLFSGDKPIRSDKRQTRWITVHPNGPGTKGTPVLVDGRGTIIGGAGGKLNGKSVRKKGGGAGDKPSGQKPAGGAQAKPKPKKSDWQQVPKEGRDAFEQKAVAPLREHLAELDKLAANPGMGPRYAWEVATKKGQKPGDKHLTDDFVNRWKQDAESRGFDADALIDSHPEFNDLRQRIDKHRGWGNESDLPSDHRKRAETDESKPKPPADESRTKSGRNADAKGAEAKSTPKTDPNGNEFAPGVSYTTIPHQAAYQAHYATSHVPEDRAKMRQREFAHQMNDIYGSLKKSAKGDEQKLATLADEWPRFLAKARSNYLAGLSADSKTMSSMVTGAANFPTRRNQKRLDTAMNRWNEFSEHLKKGRKSILKKMHPENAPKKIGDDDAGDHIRTKLKQLREVQDAMKAANKVLRSAIDANASQAGDIVYKKGHSESSLMEKLTAIDGINEKAAKGLLEPDFAGRFGFPSYALQNNNANIKRYEQQLARQEKFESQKQQASEGEAPTEFEFEGGKVSLDYEDNRLRVHHDQKPSAEERKLLKSRGFRWSPKAGAWQRQLTENARATASQMFGIDFRPADKSEKYSGNAMAAEADHWLAEAERYRTGNPQDASPEAKGDQKLVRGEKGDIGYFITIDDHPVFIETGGKISRGPRHLRGQNVNSVPGKKLRKSRRIKPDRSGDRDSPGQVAAFPDEFGRGFTRAPETQQRASLAGDSVDAQPDRVKPKTRVDQAAVDAVGDDPEDVAHFRDLMADAHKMLSTEAQETNQDLRELLSNFGYTGKRTSQIIQKARRAHGKGGDYDKIDRFDEMADMAARSYPHLLVASQGESAGAGDNEDALMNRLRQGFEQVPSKTDERVMQLAQEMWDRDQEFRGAGDIDMGDEWSSDIPADDLDAVPFRAPALQSIVEQYRAARSFEAAFVARYYASAAHPVLN